MKYVDSIVDLVGKTPILKLNAYAKKFNLKANIFAKLESFNPAGSVKDRIAKSMIDDAITSKKITKNTTLIEPTSGNTGIGIAFIAASYGLKVILTMPETMSIERRQLLAAFGAKLVLTPGDKGMKGAILEAERLNEQIADSLILSQFSNPANPKAHYENTGPEIYDAMMGKADVLVCGVGTGGTITGAGRFLKEKNPKIEIIAVEPTDSAVLSGFDAGPHKIQGIGAGFVPDVLDTKIYNQIIRISTDDSYHAARELAKTEGVLCGISSGAALYAATKLAKNSKYIGKNIVVVLPDTGERYLSTPLYEE